MAKHGKKGEQNTKFLRKKESFVKKGRLLGIYKEAKGDYGFVDILLPNGEKKGYYVHFRNKKDAMDGDEVSFCVKQYHGKEEAEIEKVTKRANRLIVGELQISPKGFGFVIPRNPSIKNDIFISERHFGKAQEGEIVGVEILSWSGKNPEGKIVQVLGVEGERGIDVFSLALEGGARIDFPQSVIGEAKKVSEAKISANSAGRKDLRELFTFTIDGEDAKDLDDAISLEKKQNGNYILYVHIADVTHYVQEKSALDIEALERGTSIYLTDRVIPMLPEELSNGVCSLNSGEDKLTLTCEMEISQNGQALHSKVYESCIKSNYRLTYNIVDNIKKNNFLTSNEKVDASKFEKRGKNMQEIIVGLEQAQKDPYLLDILKQAFELKTKIESYRKQNGYLEFDFYETKIEIDEKGDICNIRKRDKLEANKLIEHFMISANESVGKQFSKIPFLYRIHPDPVPEDVEKAVRIILNYSKNIQAARDVAKSGFTIKKAIELASGNNFLSRIILRSLTKAIYSEKNEGHFGLGLDFYSHFTSPIRRYPDLQIHRIIKEQISGKMTPTRLAHFKQILPSVAKKTSERERMAEDIERKVTDLAKVKYMATKIGQEFEGQISGVIQKGFFVELESTVEGFVDVVALGKGNFTFIEELLQLENFKNGEKFCFGEKVKVRVREVDQRLRRIDFEYIETIN